VDSQPELPFNGPYRGEPGWKREGASHDAAIQVKPKAQFLRDRTLEVLKRGDHTADEVAKILGEDKGNIRPRCSELVNLNEIEPTGERRPSSTGTPQNVWRYRRST
jgi:predicted ArsR family transcriptional regulator